MRKNTKNPYFNLERCAHVHLKLWDYVEFVDDLVVPIVSLSSLNNKIVTRQTRVDLFKLKLAKHRSLM